MSAYQRLFVWFGSLTALGALGLVVVWLYGFPVLGIEGVYSLEQRRAIVALESLSDQERDEFEHWFGNYRRELKILANSEALLATVHRDRAALVRKLAFIKELDTHGYEALYVTDARAEQVLAGATVGLKEIPPTHRRLLQAATQPGVVDFVQVLHDSASPSLLVVHQLLAQDAQGRPTGELRGLLVAQIELLAPLMTGRHVHSSKDVGTGGALLLFDARGRIVANTNTQVSNASYAHIGREIVAGAEDVRVLRAEGSPEMIVVIRHLHLGTGEGIALVMVSRTDELLAATRQVFWRIAGLGGVVFLVSMVLVYFAARLISQGEQAVRDLNANLEQRVTERTEQLAQSNWQLMQAMQDLGKTRDELVRSEKLAALGALVAGMAHEMNTPLGNAVLVATTLQEGNARFAEAVAQGLTRSALEHYMQEHDEGLALLSTNLNRAAALVSSFKQLAVDQASEQRREFNVADMVDEVLMVMSPTLRRSSHHLTAEVATGIVMESYPGPLEQVLVNFINNALLHAFNGREGGQMHIQGRLQDDLVVLKFSDDGAGMDEATRKRVFDPFFTTRLGQGGNGLGLHIAYNIVTTLLGGKIEVSSTPGAGTCFTLRLPRVAPVLKAQTA